MDIQYDFSAQTAIVTGGARGIGRAVAEQFVRSGAHVWIWDIDPVELDGAHSLTVDRQYFSQLGQERLKFLAGAGAGHFRATTSLIAK